MLRGNLFDSAIMKTSVISDEFRARYLSNPADPEAFEGRAVVFDGPEDYHTRIDDPALGIDEHTLLFMRGTGPIGYPGAAEVVNMPPPAALIQAGIQHLPCIGDGRQSGTSGSPSILNASPEAAAGGGLALLRTGDRVRIDLRRGEANMLISDEELNERRRELRTSRRLSDPAAARRRGRKCSAAAWDSSTAARCWNRRPSINASRRPSACRGTITEIAATTAAARRPSPKPNSPAHCAAAGETAAPRSRTRRRHAPECRQRTTRSQCRRSARGRRRGDGTAHI